ncbi:hypothetical protein [Actinopolyspora saharensis]|uniref:Uncharacterized protein n=1 Tax=Actinopolyspora saharensis TaxID=995062 RepID=A0A1H1GLQ4_9ACTN|nr:hypothetical protein [Actinopolyspora saharensis]SDR14099.1 hypothetical protein SAMN04489718_3729 [Actinopolyspora saharensis]
MSTPQPPHGPQQPPRVNASTSWPQQAQTPPGTHGQPAPHGGPQFAPQQHYQPRGAEPPTSSGSGRALAVTIAVATVLFSGFLAFISIRITTEQEVHSLGDRIAHVQSVVLGLDALVLLTMSVLLLSRSKLTKPVATASLVLTAVERCVGTLMHVIVTNQWLALVNIGATVSPVEDLVFYISFIPAVMIFLPVVLKTLRTNPVGRQS